MVTPTPPPMPKIPLISGSKREKNSHDNQGEQLFLQANLQAIRSARNVKIDVFFYGL